MEENAVKINVDEEAYEEAMIDYQLVVIDILNKALIENGIEDAELRQNICSSFDSRQSPLLDQGWLKGATEKVFPEVVFSKRTFCQDEGLLDMEEVILPEYASNFHEYGAGSLEEYFGESDQKLSNLDYSIEAS